MRSVAQFMSIRLADLGCLSPLLLTPPIVPVMQYAVAVMDAYALQ